MRGDEAEDDDDDSIKGPPAVKEEVPARIRLGALTVMQLGEVFNCLS